MGRLATTICLTLALASPSLAAKPNKRSLELLHRGLQAYEEGRLEAAEHLLGEAIKGAESKTARAFRSIVRWTKHDMPGAKKDALAGAQLRPNDAESFTARGMARFVLDERGGASADFQRATRLDSDYGLAYLGLGSIRSAQHALPEALIHLDRAIHLSNRPAMAYIARGAVLEKMGEFEKASLDYSRVLAIAPSLGHAYYYRGRCYVKLRQNDKAIDDLSRFLARNPEHVNALYQRGAALFSTGDYSRAIKDLDRVILLKPDHGMAYANRAGARQALGDVAGAEEDYKRALQFSPEKSGKIQEQMDALLLRRDGRTVSGGEELLAMRPTGRDGGDFWSRERTEMDTMRDSPAPLPSRRQAAEQPEDAPRLRGGLLTRLGASLRKGLLEPVMVSVRRAPEPEPARVQSSRKRAVSTERYPDPDDVQARKRAASTEKYPDQDDVPARKGGFFKSFFTPRETTDRGFEDETLYIH